MNAAPPVEALIACHECDALQREVALPPGGAARCICCGATLYRDAPDAIDRTLALALAAMMLMIVSNIFPLVDLDAKGNITSTTLFGTVQALYNTGMPSVAGLVFVTTMLMPALQVAALLYMLAPLQFNRIPYFLPEMFRLVQDVKAWSMIEVFMLGTLVALAKLAAIASVRVDIALWSLGALMFTLAAASAAFDARAFWARVAEVRRCR